MSIKYTPNTLKKLEQLFEECNYLIRQEKGNFMSGTCILEHKKVIVINKFLDLEGKINTLIEILPTIKVSPENLSDGMLDFYNLMMNKPIPTPINQ